MSLADLQWCPTSVQVTVLQSRGLRIKGKNGTNDAYAIMQVGKEKFQTSVVEKSVAPVWKEEAAFDLPPPQLQLQAGRGGTERGTLHVHILHRALVGPDKLLGQAVINLLELSEDKTRNKTEWFKLLDKTGKADKDRGEVLVDIQFMRNNMTASMFDLSAAGKSKSRLGKFKDKVRGKKKESDATSNVVPSFSQVLTDSEEEGSGEATAGKEDKKKKHKMKSLFSTKSNLQRNMSQSMSILPAKNSSLSGSQSSGLNVDSSEGKKKFKFMIHKRSGSSDSKDSSSSHQKHVAAEQSNLCINGSHVYCEDLPPRTSRIGSNFSLTSSGHGSMEDVPESSPPSVDSLRAVRQYSPWTEEEEEEENLKEDVEEQRGEEERIMMEEERRKKQEEEDRVRNQEQELERLAEENRQEEEKRREEKGREEERVRKVEEDRIRREQEERAHEERRRQEEEERERLAGEKRRQEERERIEEDKVRKEEEERIKMEEKERAQEERRLQEEEERERLAEERRRKEEQERIEEEKVRKEEEERIKMEEERAEEETRREEKERARRQEEECKLAEEKRRLEEEEQRQIEEEELRKEEEKSIRRKQERAEEEKRKQVEEEMVRKQEEEKKRLEEQENMQREEEGRIRMEEERAQEERRRKEEEELARREQQCTLAEEKRRLEEERIKQEMLRKEKEERIRREKEKAEEEGRQREKEEMLRREEKEHEEHKRRQREEEERIKKEEKEKEEYEEKCRREEEEMKKMKQEEEEMIRLEKEMRRKEEEYKQLTEEKRQLEEQERKRIEEEEKRQRDEEERINKEEQRAKKEKEEYERLLEEQIRQETKRIEEEEKFKREEEERIRMEENAQKDREEKQARKLKEEKATQEEKQKKKDETQNRHKAAGKKVAVEIPVEVCSNPFDTNFSTNPFEEDLVSPAGPDSSTDKMSTIKERVQSAAPLVGSKAISTDEKDPISTERERRPAPQPPGRNHEERPSQKEQNGSAQQLAHISKKSSDKGIKTVSVLPQRSVQMIAPLSRPSTDTNNTRSLTQSSATKETSNEAKHSKRPAPLRPPSVEEEPSSKPKTTLSSDGNNSHKCISVAKQVPIAYGLNPFEDDEDDIAAKDEAVPSAETGSVQKPPVASQAADKDAASQTKTQSSKARAPLPSAKKAAKLSTLINQKTEGDHVTAPCDPKSEAKNALHIQEANLRESQPATVQSIGEAAGEKKDGPLVPLRRLQPVKPLNALEQQSVSVVQGERDTKSSRIRCEDQEQTKVNAPGLKGPYSQLTQEELISLVLKQENQLSERDKKISELEQYIDNLLVRIIEEQPSILMSLNSAKKTA
ncbi:hypothetical protein PBY51_023623 [Eleginops maclovinus]|uniref:Rab11 family-interacting protein 1 n=1 Tax=Eleginops maclovinus TaxID=56733 RepID=A0AAN7X069_ELEMC|nr:hypothetical protein PBY51_023623 [Eleginops maclovinus]